MIRHSRNQPNVKPGESPAEELPRLRRRVDELERQATASRRAREALRTDKERFRAVFDHVAAIVAVTDKDGRWLHVNQHMIDALGYSAAELMQMRADDVTHPEDRGQTAGLLGRLLRREIPQYRVERRYLRKDGSTLWVDLSVSPQHNEQGDVEGLIEVGFNITEQKKAIEALQESERNFRAIADYTCSLEVWVGIHGRPIWLNPIVERLTGYAVEECLAMPDFPAPLVHEDDRPRILALYRQACEGSSGSDIQYRLVHRNGSTTWMSTSWQPIYSIDGACIGWRSSHRDISEHRQSQQQAEQRQAELLHISRLNTLGEMASGLAHELNQPLSAIMSFAGASLRSIQSGEIDRSRLIRNIEQIVAQSTRAGEIIRRVRALAQRRPSSLGRVHVNEVIHVVLDLLGPDLRHKEIEVALELCESLPPVPADAIQLEQVLLNLMRNAIEAMEIAGVRRRQLTLRTQIEPKDAVRIIVSDTGPGIPPEIMARVFDPFFTTKENGLGVGLSISRSIIESHRGQLRVDSGPEGGCTFTFTLPAAQPDPPGDPSQTESGQRFER